MVDSFLDEIDTIDKPSNKILRFFHDTLYDIVSGDNSNQQIVRFQRICGVQLDGKTTNKTLNIFFRTASACGEEIFSLMPVMIWFAYPLSHSFLTNFVFLLLVGQIVKDVFKLPRPSSNGTGIFKLGDQHFETEYGRLYLGVHSVVDVLAGLILGASLTVMLHYFGDNYVDYFIYYRVEGILVIAAATLTFLLFYPRPRPWRAGFGTSAQILGSWIGGAVSMWYLQHVQPDLLLIMQNNSFIEEYSQQSSASAKSNIVFEYHWNFSRKSLYILFVSLVLVAISKFLVKYVALKIFSFLAEKVVFFRPHPLEKTDSLGNEVPVSKAYSVEVPVDKLRLPWLDGRSPLPLIVDVSRLEKGTRDGQLEGKRDGLSDGFDEGYCEGAIDGFVVGLNVGKRDGLVGRKVGFLTGADKKKTDPHFFTKLGVIHNPKYLYIGCSDSRLPVHQILGLNEGDVFVHRNVGNLVPSNDLNALSVVEYAISNVGVTDIIVTGHYDCGAVRAATSRQDLGLLEHWLRQIRDVHRLHKEYLDLIEDEEKKHSSLVELNVVEQCLNLYKTGAVQRAQIEVRKNLLEKQALSPVSGFNIDHEVYPRIHGLVFDPANGQLKKLKVDFSRRIGSLEHIYKLYD
eukprot:gene27056-35768_t